MLLYAIPNEVAARARVEEALALRFELHESLYLGGNYWVAESSDEGLNVRILPNRDLLWEPGQPERERFAFPDYPGHFWILEVQGETPEVGTKLSGVEALELLSSGSG